eukprot:365088-Chlamydomonas_euryale.AAC.5
MLSFFGVVVILLVVDVVVVFVLYAHLESRTSTYSRAGGVLRCERGAVACGAAAAAPPRRRDGAGGGRQREARRSRQPAQGAVGDASDVERGGLSV